MCGCASPCECACYSRVCDRAPPPPPRTHARRLQAVEVHGSDYTIVFLDTEGLGSTIRGASYDTRIFALAILLSSYFIYNSTGVIDGDAIASLSLVVSLTKHIHVRSGADDGVRALHPCARFLCSMGWGMSAPSPPPRSTVLCACPPPRVLPPRAGRNRV